MKRTAQIASWGLVALAVVGVVYLGPSFWTIFPLLSLGAALAVFHSELGSARSFIALALRLNLLFAAGLTFLTGVWIGSGRFDSRVVGVEATAEAAAGAVLWLAPLLNVLALLRQWRGSKVVLDGGRLP